MYCWLIHDESLHVHFLACNDRNNQLLLQTAEDGTRNDILETNIYVSANIFQGRLQ